MRYNSEVNGEFRVHEDPICLVDAAKSIAASQLATSSDSSQARNDVSLVRLTGLNLGTIIRNTCQNLNLDLSRCIGQGMDGASNMSSDTTGAAAVIGQDAHMALYFHCMMHCFNLCASQSVKFVAIRNCIDVVREIIGFFSFNAPRNHLSTE